jgi:hypothetical protein
VQRKLQNVDTLRDREMISGKRQVKEFQISRKVESKLMLPGSSRIFSCLSDIIQIFMLTINSKLIILKG